MYHWAITSQFQVTDMMQKKLNKFEIGAICNYDYLEIDK